MNEVEHCKGDESTACKLLADGSKVTMPSMLAAVLELFLLLDPSLSAATASTATYVPPPDPGPSPLCPSDMRLVVREHYERIERLCLRVRQNRCWDFVPFVSAAEGPRKKLKFCMDQYEAPNKPGERPYVMRNFLQAKAWCEERSKRLCTEQEFEAACEGDEQKPFFYGWTVDRHVCNSDKPWKPFDAAALERGGEAGRREAQRLWQGANSGAYPRCRTQDGIYDLLGNVEEWVTSRKGRRWPGALMGGFWAKPWTGCRGTNDAHLPTFRFYEVGWRCCKDPAPRDG